MCTHLVLYLAPIVVMAIRDGLSTHVSTGDHPARCLCPMFIVVTAFRCRVVV